MYTYLLLNLFVLAGPMSRSFDNRVRFFSRWKAWLPALAVPGTLFIIWDVLFTAYGVWGFNDTYLSGIRLLGLPLGEWLFFITVPYACVFIYEVLNFFFPKPLPVKPYVRLGWGLVAFLGLAGVALYPRLYSSITFCLTALALVPFLLAKPVWIGKFFRAYAVSLIPFLLVNGMLTGTGIKEQVVWYSPEHIIGWRIVTIPVEDSIYLLLLLLGNIAIYQWLRPKTD